MDNQRKKTILSSFPMTLAGATALGGGAKFYKQFYESQLKAPQGVQQFPQVRPWKFMTTPRVIKPSVYAGVSGASFGAMGAFAKGFHDATDIRTKTLMVMGALGTGFFGGAMQSAKTNLFQKIGTRPALHMIGLKQMIKAPSVRQAMVRSGILGMGFGLGAIGMAQMKKSLEQQKKV